MTAIFEEEKKISVKKPGKKLFLDSGTLHLCCKALNSRSRSDEAMKLYELLYKILGALDEK